MKVADIYIAVGSNIEPEKNIVAAVAELRERTEEIAVSTFYRTKPLTRPEQADYRNGVVHVRILLERSEAERDLLKPIEATLGRERTADKHAARTIDLDLAVYCEDGRPVWMDDEVLQRNFIAVPLAELAPTLRLPNSETAAQVADKLGKAGLVADEALTKRLRELLNA